MVNERPLSLPKNIYAYSRETIKGRKAGDTVWACAFEFNMKKSSLGLSQEPVQGILAYTDVQETHDNYTEKYRQNPHAMSPRYFIPINKKGTGYLWSKAVMISSRAYADTYDDCCAIYSEMVENWIGWFKRGVALCKEYI